MSELKPMHVITYYAKADGHIQGFSSVREGEEEVGLPDETGWIDGLHDGGELRIDLATLQPVPLLEFDVPDEADDRFDGLPIDDEGVKAIINLQGHIITDGHIELSGDLGLEQTVLVQLSKRLYRPKTVRLTCHRSS